MGKRIDVKIGFNCNNRCKFCVQGEKRFNLSEKTKEKVLSEIRKGKASGADSVVFTGGEPTINKNLSEYIRYAKKLGFKIIQIQTNGRMFAYRDFCKQIIESGANQFSPALHGSTASMHDFLTGADGAFDQVIAGIKNLKSLGQEVIINIVVTEKNYEDLPKIAQLLCDLGVDQFQFAFVHIVGTAWVNKETIVPRVSLAMPYIKAGLEIGLKNGVRVMTEAIPYCLMRGYEDCVAEKIIPESMVFDADFVIDDYTKYRKERGKVKSKTCAKCEYSNVCEGPWHEYPELFGWDEFIPVQKDGSGTAQKKFDLYREYLKEAKPFYNNFFLAELLIWLSDSSVVNAAKIKEYWKKYLNSTTGAVINFYVHIPFCESRCSYCMYYSRLGSQKNIDKYIDNLLAQAEYFKEVFVGHKFSSIHFGGGTPSILSEEQIVRLMDGIFNNFSFDNGELTFECNPRSITVEKLKILKKYRINRVSFGVQNFDKNVLHHANRGNQDYDLVKTAIQDAKSLGFEVNSDLMIGLMGDSIEKIVDSFDVLSKLKPDTITLYTLKPSAEYLRDFYNNDGKYFLNDLDKKAVAVRAAIMEKHEEFDYLTNNSDNDIFTSAEPVFYRKGYKTAYDSSYDYTAPLNFDKSHSLFALGTTGSSYIFNSLQYHIVEGANDEGNFNPEKENYWMQELDLKSEMRYFVLQNFAHKKSLLLNDFRAFFKQDFEDVFAREIKELKMIKKIEVTEAEVFLPFEPLDRYASSLFFFNERDVSDKIKYEKNNKNGKS